MLAIGESKVLKTNSERSKLLDNFLTSCKESVVIDGHDIPYILQCYVGDSLAAHGVGGFKESFNPKVKQQCSKCLTATNEYCSTFFHSQSHPKTEDKYHEQLNKLMSCSTDEYVKISQETGLKGISLFNSIETFSVISDILIDVMHVFLEGIAVKETQLFIKYLFNNKIINRTDLNERLKTFSFAKSIKKSDYPRSIDANGTLVTKSKNMLILIPHLPFILKNVIPEDKYL